jgi:hypothetical protein
LSAIHQQLVEPTTCRGLGRKAGTELGLTARPTKEEDKVAGDGERHLSPKILLNQREAEINPGSDAR